jgi:hypothetical protein
MPAVSQNLREKRLSPRRAPRRSLLPLSPRRTKVLLKPLLHSSWLTPAHTEPTVGLQRKSAACGLSGCPPTFGGSPPFKSSTAFRALAPTASFRGSLRFRPKNMAHHIFQLETELQNIPEGAPKASRSFSVSEKLARCGSSALSGAEHLRLLVGKDSIAEALLRHFGSLKALSRASFKELRQFLPKGKAEAVMAARLPPLRTIACYCCRSFLRKPSEFRMSMLYRGRHIHGEVRSLPGQAKSLPTGRRRLSPLSDSRLAQADNDSQRSPDREKQIHRRRPF